MTDEECDHCERETGLLSFREGRYCAVCISAFTDPDAEAEP